MGQLAKVELSCHLDINAHSKIVKLKRRRRLERSKAVFGNSSFLVTKPDSVVQVLPSQSKKETVERLPKLYPK